MIYRQYESTDGLEFVDAHASAMTGEKLHSKREIAAELAVRDEVIKALCDVVLQVAVESQDTGIMAQAADIVRPHLARLPQ